MRRVYRAADVVVRLSIVLVGIQLAVCPSHEAEVEATTP
jgi:hypothetical protein